MATGPFYTGMAGPYAIQRLNELWEGGEGVQRYTHTQSISAAVWTVAHNLGRKPAVAVTDHTGLLVTPDIKYLDNDILQITHGTPMTGFVYCN